MCDDNVREMLLDAVTLLKAKGVNAPLTVERIEQYLNSSSSRPILKPCPECGSNTIGITSQRLKLCTCGWKDENWTLDKDQKPLYG